MKVTDGLLGGNNRSVRGRAVALAVAAAALGLVATVMMVHGSSAVSLMQWQPRFIMAESPMLNFKEGYLGDFPNDYEDKSKLAGYLDQYENSYADGKNLAGYLDQYENSYADGKNLAGYLDQYENEYAAGGDSLAGYLAKYPNMYEGDESALGGYLARFPVDTTAETCGKGACNDETGCDDEAFMGCMRQLNHMRAVNGPILVQEDGPVSACGAVACNARQGCSNQAYFQCANLQRQERMVRQMGAIRRQ